MTYVLAILAVVLSAAGFYKAWLTEKRFYELCGDITRWIRVVNGRLNEDMPSEQTETP